MAKEGRPTKYKKEFDKLAYDVAAIGAIDEEIASVLGVCTDTLNEWKGLYPEFSVSIQTGKAHADSKVQKSLFRRATGYTQETVKVFCYEGSSFEHPITEIIAPETNAASLWLRNRRKEEWRDKVEITGKDDGPIRFALIKDEDE